MAVNLSGLFGQLSEAGSQYGGGVMPKDPNERSVLQAAGVTNPMLQLFGQGLAGATGLDFSSPNERIRTDIKQQAATLPEDAQQRVAMLAKTDPQRAMLQLQTEQAKAKDKAYVQTYDAYQRALANDQPVVAARLAGELSSKYADKFTLDAQVKAQTTANASKDQPRSEFIQQASIEIRDLVRSGATDELAKKVAELQQRSSAFGTPVNIQELVSKEQQNARLASTLKTEQDDRRFKEALYNQLLTEDPQAAAAYKDFPEARSNKSTLAWLQGERDEAEAEERQIEGEKRRATLTGKESKAIVSDKTVFDSVGDKVFNAVIGDVALSKEARAKVRTAFTQGISGVYASAKNNMTRDEVAALISSAIASDPRIEEIIKEGSDEFDEWWDGKDAQSLSGLITAAIQEQMKAGGGGAVVETGGASFTVRQKGN